MAHFKAHLLDVFINEFERVLTMNYRERLRELREDMNLTQTEVGIVLDKCQQGYNHIEAGCAELKIEDLVTLCKFYNVSSDYIVGFTDRKNPLKR